MEKVAELLKTTNMKIIEIANAVGYENQGQFASVFAKEYGATPLGFRRFSVNEICGLKRIYYGLLKPEQS